MTDNLLSRVKRLVTGSVTNLIDAVETAAPETVMKESIREIDRALDEVRANLGVALSNRHHANKRLSDAAARHEELGRQLQVAVTEKRDDLAEAVIVRQLDLEAQMPLLERALSDSGAEAKELEGYIAALAARKRDMESDLAQFTSSRAASGAPAVGNAGSTVDRRVENAATAFDRVLGAKTGLPGTTAPERDVAAKLAELEKLERANRIRERLAAAKASQ
jgi:phage shock protein A